MESSGRSAADSDRLTEHGRRDDRAPAEDTRGGGEMCSSSTAAGTAGPASARGLSSYALGVSARILSLASPIRALPTRYRALSR